MAATETLSKGSAAEEEFHRRILHPAVTSAGEGHYRMRPSVGHYHQPESDESDVDIDVTGMHCSLLALLGM